VHTKSKLIDKKHKNQNHIISHTFNWLSIRSSSSRAFITEAFSGSLTAPLNESLGTDPLAVVPFVGCDVLDV
jgi:hypothetical protein